jgi:hypothetical protein
MRSGIRGVPASLKDMYRTPALVTALALLAAGATAASAQAATFVARPADGGRIELRTGGGALRVLKATLPARCENEFGNVWTDTLGVDLAGTVAIEGGRFGVQGQAPSKVRYQLGGRRRARAITGRLRLTYVFIDQVVVVTDKSYLCDTGVLRFRAVRR